MLREYVFGEIGNMGSRPQTEDNHRKMTNPFTVLDLTTSLSDYLILALNNVVKFHSCVSDFIDDVDNRNVRNESFPLTT